jgi:hypothetical protein
MLPVLDHIPADKFECLYSIFRIEIGLLLEYYFEQILLYEGVKREKGLKQADQKHILGCSMIASEWSRMVWEHSE